eukprot:gnl/MRDRNA2_/MRDRNA2_166947_c0_seq1.p1 gnl/MRDRNA2_/MRDRNA2_166947_c0~~gnl/MRDRNA2_/MRDRNA2_166947_c0_seq1.p1  ORF type:complete len:446 (-),score=94.38 gnl/MRDRNA2_/MRDRNA2_166947_c0_seq1:843-2180(-)
MFTFKKASNHRKHATRFAALGDYAVKEASYAIRNEKESLGGFRMPHVPLFPEDSTMKAQRKPPPPPLPLPAPPDLESQVILKLPQLSAEEWDAMVAHKESKKEAKQRSKKEAKTLQGRSLPTGPAAGPVADDAMILRMQGLSLNVREGKATSADGVGRILTLSNKYKTALIDEMFHKHDVDSNGTLDIRELIPLLTEVTAVLYPRSKIVITEPEAKCFAKWADHNGDGVLDSLDLGKALELWDLYCDLKKDIELVLSRYDADLSGGLDMDEFQVMLQDLAKMNGFETPTDEELKTIFTMADANSNGIIDKAEIIFAISTYIQVKQQQTLGNQYHPLLHTWIQQRLEFIFYYVRSCEWHQEVYKEVVMMKPGRKIKKYMEDVTTASFEISGHSKSSKSTIRSNVEKLVQEFLQELEAKQKTENKAKPWKYIKRSDSILEDSEMCGA